MSNIIEKNEMDIENIKKLNEKELNDLSQKIRELIIDVVSKNGGHLASNLGVVELTLALHYCFDSPNDKILWDVGHQSYVHKILTGRKDKIYTIRKLGGLSPFSNPEESEHDHFISGHAGNTLSASFGLAKAMTLSGNNHNKVISIIGDASLSNGTSLEALNSVGGNAENLIIIVNDNEMSIGENVGSLFKYLSKIMGKNFYNNMKHEVEHVLSKIPFGTNITEVIRRLEHSVRYFIYPGSLFEELGLSYIGPLNGHNLHELINTFNEVKKRQGPVLLHIKTVKGKGYEHAENDTEKFHGISPFDIETGEVKPKNISYSKIVGDKLVELAKKDKDIVAITAAMIKGTGLSGFFEEFKSRSFDVGIAEGHAVTFAAGLARGGKKPIVAIYSTFLQRAYDQLIHDISLQNLNVTFILDRSGIVGEDGKTHQGIFDISYLNTIPNFKILSPANEFELKYALENSITKIDGPVAIRIPRERVFEMDSYEIELFKWNEIVKGKDYLFIVVGSMMKEVMGVLKKLQSLKINPTIVSSMFVKPFDEEYLKNNINKYKKVFVIEENVSAGSMGSLIIDFLNENNILKRINKICLKNEYIKHGTRKELLEINNLSGENLIKVILEGR